MSKSSVNLSSSWNRFFSDFEAGAGWPERPFVLQIMSYRALRLIEVKIVSKSEFWGFDGGHVGPEIGKLGPNMATRWH